MQLAAITAFFVLFMCMQEVKAQFLSKFFGNKNKKQLAKDSIGIDHTYYERPDWKTIDVDFLSSYYSQDGNNSPVTGGIGTEQLTDFTQKIILSIPTSKKLTLKLDGGYDYYSSASTDNIDNLQSGESGADMRIHGNIGLEHKISDYQSIGFKLGGSGEYDYTSINGGVYYNWLSQTKNTGLSFGAQAFIDRWDLIYPSELRGSAKAPTDRRQSYNASIGFSQVLNKRMQMSIQAEAIYMNGLLSTPFHRVFFTGQEQAKIENLPGKRFKVPIGLRLNTHITDWLVSRMYYRYYWDDWGIQGHTVSLELPIKLNRFLYVAPHIRYHKQSAAKYFAGYKEHKISDAYYTSDYDLAALSSLSYGLSLSYSPVNGIAKIKLPFKKRPAFVIKSIELKYSHFDRSTGLKSDIVSLGLKFSF